MKENVIRVLQIVNELGMGGIQAFIMNVYRNIDRQKIQFDFLVSTFDKGNFEDEIYAMGGKVYRVTPRKNSIIKNRKDLEKFFNEHQEYKCVHFHCSNLSYIEPLEAAMKYRVPVRIIHSHSTNIPNNFAHKILHRINKRKVSRIASDYYSCSDLAADWLYNGTGVRDSVVLVKNGIKTKDFLYSSNKRKTYRGKLGIENKVVFANVGRFCEAKNHEFLFDVFSYISSKVDNSILLLIGDGESRKEFEDKISALGIKDRVILLGMRKDVSSILQAIDYIIMPSKWEGFPVSLIEEQAAGLPCFISDSITKQAKINDNVKYLALKEGADQWGKYIVENYLSLQRCENVDSIIAAGFDIKSTVFILEDKYVRSTNRYESK